MPLTKTEQAELDELNKLAGIEPQGLSEAERIELDELDRIVRTQTFDPNIPQIQKVQPIVPKRGPTISAREPTFGERFVDPALQRLGLGEARFGGPIQQLAKEKGGALATGIKEEGPLFIGETIGELTLSKFGAKGRIIGAGGGRATADAMVQILQQILKSPKAPRTSKDAAARLLNEFKIGAGSELLFEGFLRAGKRIATPFLKEAAGEVAEATAKSILPKPIPEADQIFRLAKEAGIDLTPAQKTVSRGIDTLEEMAENAFFGRGRLRDVKQIAQPAGIRRATDRLMDIILPRAKRVGRDELGEILNDAITERNKVFREAGAALYNRVDDLTTKQIKKAEVSLSPLKELAQKLQKERIKEGGLKKPVDDIISDLLQRPDVTDFKTAHRIRSEFLETVRNAPSKKDRIAGIARQSASMMDRQMEKAAKDLSPEALSAWRTANAFWKKGKQTFNSQVVKRVTKAISNETPEKVVDAVFARKSPKQVRTIMELADPLTRQRLRFAFLDDLISKASAQIPGDVADVRTLIGKTFIDKFDTLGDDMLDAAFGESLKKRIRNTARLAKITQGRTGGAGGFLIQLIQAGPIGASGAGIVTGSPELAKKGLVAAIPIGVFTDGMSRLLVSKRGSRILTDSLNTKPGTDAAIRATLRLVREIEREHLRSKRQRKIDSAREILGTSPLKEFRGVGRRL